MRVLVNMKDLTKLQRDTRMAQLQARPPRTQKRCVGSEATCQGSGAVLAVIECVLCPNTFLPQAARQLAEDAGAREDVESLNREMQSEVRRRPYPAGGHVLKFRRSVRRTGGAPLTAATHPHFPWASQGPLELLCVVRALLKKMQRRIFVGDFVTVSAIDWVASRGSIHEVRGHQISGKDARVDRLSGLSLSRLRHLTRNPSTLVAARASFGAEGPACGKC